jgi:hypothetical protein
MARTDGEWWLDGGTVAVDVDVPAPRPATPIAAARLAGLALSAGALSALLAARHGDDLVPTLQALLVAATAAVLLTATTWTGRLRHVPAVTPDRDVFGPSRTDLAAAAVGGTGPLLGPAMCLAASGGMPFVIPLLVAVLTDRVAALALMRRWERRTGQRLVDRADGDAPARLHAAPAVRPDTAV